MTRSAPSEVGRVSGDADVGDVGEQVQLVEVRCVRVADDGDVRRWAGRRGADGGALLVGQLVVEHREGPGVGHCRYGP